jgi:hypothetical protein
MSVAVKGDRLLYAGKVRSGYTEAVARDLRERLDPYIRKGSPLSEPVKKPKATWVEPVIEAEVAYSTVTENYLLRKAVFKGLREDRESPGGAHSGGRVPRRPAIKPPSRSSPASQSWRGFIERNAIARLSNYDLGPLDPPSEA